jgi:hypothetical protein
VSGSSFRLNSHSKFESKRAIKNICKEFAKVIIEFRMAVEEGKPVIQVTFKRQFIMHLNNKIQNY